jgi:hypothetical protein
VTTLYAWLFDAYPSDAGMTTWWIDADGRAHALADDLTPAFYVRGPRSDLHNLCVWLRAQAFPPIALRRTERTDLFLDRAVEVLKVGVSQPAAFTRLFRQTADAFPRLTYYDADIPLPQRYVLTRGIFPLAYCAIEHQAGQIVDLQPLDTPWEPEYRLPPLRVMALRLAGELRDPSRGHRGDLLVEIDGRQHIFPRRHSRQLVLMRGHLLEQHDPDLLVTAYGDSYLLPRLLALSEHFHIPLPLNRDLRQTVAHKAAHSYFSYGRIVFRNEQHLLYGRWHIDRQNAFSRDYGPKAQLEIAHLTGLSGADRGARLHRHRHQRHAGQYRLAPRRARPVAETSARVAQDRRRPARRRQGRAGLQPDRRAAPARRRTGFLGHVPEHHGAFQPVARDGRRGMLRGDTGARDRHAGVLPSPGAVPDAPRCSKRFQYGVHPPAA